MSFSIACSYMFEVFLENADSSYVEHFDKWSLNNILPPVALAHPSFTFHHINQIIKVMTK